VYFFFFAAPQKTEIVTTTSCGEPALNSFTHAETLWSRVSVKVYVWLFFLLLLFWNLVFKWWISCAVTQQWDIYHIGTQMRGGKRKAELTRLTSQVSTCWQLNPYRSMNTAHLIVIKPLFYWNVLKHTIIYHVHRLVLSLRAWNRERRKREGDI